MNDILPEQTALWQWLEGKVRDVLASYGYQEIRMPIVEQTDLFKRSIGEVTDIVEKEMYTFEDKSGEKITMRPEGTASGNRRRRQSVSLRQLRRSPVRTIPRQQVVGWPDRRSSRRQVVPGGRGTRS